MGSLLSLLASGFMGFFSSIANHGLPEHAPPVHFHDKPAMVPLKSNKPGEEPVLVSLKDLVESKVKSLFTPFRPLWWIYNGHFQTLYCVFGDFSKTEQMFYNRRLLRLADGGTIGLDFTPVDDSNIPEDTPIVVVKHGLTGGSYEAYVRAILSRACAPVEKGGLGYRAVVCNFRGCAGTPLTAPQLYSAGYTDDLRQALMYIHHQYPKAPLIGVGFSLGANVMTRYLAQEGEQSRLASACALGCPWDLALNNDGLERSFLGRHVYSKGMARNLLNLVKRHNVALKSDPDHYVAKVVDQALALKSPTLEQFDDTFTCIAGGAPPVWPFKSAKDYYRYSSSHDVLDGIRVPFLAINAADDPVVRHVPMEGAGNGYVVMKLTRHGGHLGWFQAGPGFVDRWTTKPALEWLQLTGGELAVSTSRTYPKLFKDENGFIREEGRPGLGCKEIPGGGVVDGNRGESGTFQGL